MPLPSLNVSLPAPRVAAGLEDRTVTGVALPYREVGRTNVGAVSVAAGALSIPADLRTVKLFSDHGRATPVGYALTADDSTERLDMSFRVGATPAGDTALLEASEGIRDALSVELSDVTITGGVITSATLDAVALVPLPAYRSARLLVAADTDPDDAELEVTVTVTEPPPAADPDPDADDTADDDTEGDTVPTTAPPAPPTPPTSALTAARAADPAALIAAGKARLQAVMRGANDAAQVNAALTDIVPAVDPAEGYLRRQWVDELWTPYYLEQFLSNAVTQAPLTGTEVVGWRWKTRPVVGPYAGNKGPIPSSPVLLEPATATPYRVAGGWDVDRIFADLGQGDFIGAVLDAAAIDAAAKMETKVADSIMAAARIVDTTTAADVFAEISALVTALVTAGSGVTFVGLAPDKFAEVFTPSTADAPWWLTTGAGGSVSVSLSGQNGTAAGISFGMSTGLPDGVIVAGDKRAMTHYQSPNVRLQALNIPNGGIDCGLFLYGADLVHSTAGLVINTDLTP